MRRIGTGDGLAGISHAADSVMGKKPTGTGEGAGKEFGMTFANENKRLKICIHEVLKDKKYIIPDYQRPYRWSEDECTKLWDDIVEATEKPEDDYFLGTIVTYPDNDGNLNVVDGQQRITSFFLLLRAFYSALEKQNAEGVTGLIQSIRSCIWDTDKISGNIIDNAKIHIESNAISDASNDALHQILKTGECDPKKKDTYSENYRFFMKKCDEFSREDYVGTKWSELCRFILYNCVILPIECPNDDTALTIFNTLNDRGLPLSNADIFKAKIYKSLAVGKRKEFIEDWNALDKVCETAGIHIDMVFRYYMHYLRALEGKNVKEIDIRTFYCEEKERYLKRTDLMGDLSSLANFWMVIITSDKKDTQENGYTISFSAKKWLHCLSAYPNELWQYPVSVFFLKRKSTPDFDKDFCRLLERLIVLLFVKFIKHPSVNAIKSDIYNAYIAIAKGEDICAISSDADVSALEIRMLNECPPAMVKPLLLLDAYLDKDQNELIQKKCQIEHIFPRKYQDNYHNWSEEDAQNYLERLGNKVVFERQLNIQANNKYFENKKERYCQSDIASVRALGSLSQNDWDKKDIENRDKDIFKRFSKFISDVTKGFSLPPTDRSVTDAKIPASEAAKTGNNGLNLPQTAGGTNLAAGSPSFRTEDGSVLTAIRQALQELVDQNRILCSEEDMALKAPCFRTAVLDALLPPVVNKKFAYFPSGQKYFCRFCSRESKWRLVLDIAIQELEQEPQTYAVICKISECNGKAIKGKTYTAYSKAFDFSGCSPDEIATKVKKAVQDMLGWEAACLKAIGE
jgi:hypothetical protein